jgi:hypothetical protein
MSNLHSYWRRHPYQRRFFLAVALPLIIVAELLDWTIYRLFTPAGLRVETFRDRVGQFCDAVYEVWFDRERAQSDELT